MSNQHSKCDDCYKAHFPEVHSNQDSQDVKQNTSDLTNRDEMLSDSQDELELIVHKISAGIGGFGEHNGVYYDGISENDGLTLINALIEQRERAARYKARFEAIQAIEKLMDASQSKEQSNGQGTPRENTL